MDRLSRFADTGRVSYLTLSVTIELEQNLDSVAGGSNMNAITHSLISWAQRTGKLGALIQGALHANPESPDLRAFLSSLTG